MFKPHIQQYFFIILTVFIIQGCVSVPSDVIMPTWDTNLNVPFATKSYTLADIIKSQNYISISAAQDSVYLINSDTVKQSVSIGNFIKVSMGGTVSIPIIPTDGTEYQLTVPFPENAELDSATFVKGTLKITGYNTSTISSSVITVRIPGIILTNGSQAILSVNVPINSTRTDSINLAGATYLAPATQFFPGFDMYAKATGTFGKVSLDAYTSDFYFSRVTGYLPTKSLGLQSSTLALNLGDATKYRDKVFLKTGTLNLQGSYQSSASNPFVIKVDSLKILGKRNNTGATMYLSYNTPQDTFRFNSDGTLSLPAYTESNSNITSFITFLPDSLKITAGYIMNPDNSKIYHTATSTDIVKFTSNFSTKSFLAIKQTSFLDTLALDMSQDNRDQIAKGQGVTAISNIQNAIALSSWVKVTLTDQYYHPLFVVTRDTIAHADSISLAGAAVDINGNVTNPGASTTTISLDSTQIKLLAQSAHFALVSVTVSTTGANNAPVLIRAKDWIKLNVYGSVNYRIKGDNK
jgi:hypothetical protein